MNAVNTSRPPGTPADTPPGASLSAATDAAARADATPWADRTAPTSARVEDLVARMSLEEKCAQLVGVWVGVDPDGGVAPLQDRTIGAMPPLEEVVRHGMGQLARTFGTRPVDPAEGARALRRTQAAIAATSRFGLAAVAHEECLTGLTAWRATVFPTPLAWGAAWDPDLVEEMAAAIGTTMRGLGVHQGLAPVLDVVRDLRWGRVEECIAEDPYLVARTGAAYVRGLERTGVVATLKHFVGYSASRGARNLAPVSVGPRELADVLLPPFEAALRDGGARSVMTSYTELDGVPSAADRTLLTDLLRDRWGFDGTVVADYFAVTFLVGQHGTAADDGEAAVRALTAGVDVELPSPRCYVEPLVAAVRAGRVGEDLVDRALRRVLRQKVDLGLVDGAWDREPDSLDLDPPEHRALARRLADRSVVLLADDGALPLPAGLRRVAVVGPNADDPYALMGCYAFPNHVGVRHPQVPLGVAVPTVLDAVRAALPDAAVRHAAGCDVRDPGLDLDAVLRAVDGAEVCLAVLGDRAGLFGAGTSGEGCDAPDLELPGEQGALLDLLLDASAGTGVPVVAVLLSGRPHVLTPWLDRLAGVVQAFFPGEEGAVAVVDVLLGRREPQGRLPVSVPRHSGAQPGTYLTPPLGGLSGVSALDPTPQFPFGHGLSYTTVAYEDLALPSAVATDGTVTVACTVRNTGGRPVDEVVQVYVRDVVAEVTRPALELAGFARVPLEPGAAARVTFDLHTDRVSFTGLDLQRVVEPGELRVLVGRSAGDLPLVGSVDLVGPRRVVAEGRVLSTPVHVRPLEGPAGSWRGDERPAGGEHPPAR